MIGGGLPVGAFGGKREIMSHIAPLGPVYQAGTLSGNPLAMAAGLTMLNALSEGDVHESLAAKAEYLTQGLEVVAARHGVPFTTTCVGGMFGLFFSERAEIRGFADATACDTEAFGRFYHAMLDQGVYLAPSAFEAGFISDAHSEADLDATLAAADQAFASLT